MIPGQLHNHKYRTKCEFNSLIQYLVPNEDMEADRNIAQPPN